MNSTPSQTLADEARLGEGEGWVGAVRLAQVGCGAGRGEDAGEYPLPFSFISSPELWAPPVAHGTVPPAQQAQCVGGQSLLTSCRRRWQRQTGRPPAAPPVSNATSEGYRPGPAPLPPPPLLSPCGLLVISAAASGVTFTLGRSTAACYDWIGDKSILSASGLARVPIRATEMQLDSQHFPTTPNVINQLRHVWYPKLSFIRFAMRLWD